MTSAAKSFLDQITVHPEVRPIFVVGSVRSGTSITMTALRGGAKLPGFDEGNVGSMIQRMLDRTRKSFEELRQSAGTGLSHGLLQAAEDELSAHLVNGLSDLYVRTMGEGPWFDKSPESYLSAPMIRFCPLLAHAFPQAKFIWCIRRGIENILSRQRKFQGIPFDSFCRSWADAVEQWFAVRDQLKGRAVEAHQHEIAIDPAKVAHLIAETLGFSDAQRRGVEEIFATERAEQSRAASEHRFIGLDETPWDAKERATFKEICGPWMEALGYPLEAKILAATPAIGLFFPVVESAVARENVPPEEWGFCKIGDHGLQLHPNVPGGPQAAIRYLDIPLAGHCRFQAEIHLAKQAGGPVALELRIERAGTKEVLVRLQNELSPGKTLHWDQAFTPIEGRTDVVIGVRMKSDEGTADHAATVWHDARLMPSAL